MDVPKDDVSGEGEEEEEEVLGIPREMGIWLDHFHQVHEEKEAGQERRVPSVSEGIDNRQVPEQVQIAQHGEVNGPDRPRPAAPQPSLL